MSISSALTSLQADITAARSAITTKGGTVTSGGGSSQLATDIATIPTGSTPTGTITITQNGTGIDVAQYATADVNVQGASIATFEQSTFPASDIYGVAYGNGKFVAVQWRSTYFAYSTDGQNWTTGSLPYNTNGNIAFGNGMFVAHPYTSRRFLYSYDGINWSAANALGFDINLSGAICYGGNKFVAIGQFGSSSYMPCYSYDGINWDAGSYGSGSEFSNISSIAYCNGVFVALTTSETAYAYSTDGISWQYRSMPSGKFGRVASGGGKFVVVATNQYNSTTARIQYSYDGLSWSQSAFSVWTAKSGDRIEFALGVFIKYSGTAAYFSTDAINWTPFTLPLSPTGSIQHPITEGDGKIVYMAEGKSLMCDRRPQFA